MAFSIYNYVEYVLYSLKFIYPYNIFPATFFFLGRTYSFYLLIPVVVDQFLRQKNYNFTLFESKYTIVCEIFHRFCGTCEVNNPRSVDVLMIVPLE